MRNTPRLFTMLLTTAALLSSGVLAQADQYHGNGNTGFGGAIGNGTLTLSDDGTNISGSLTVGGSMNDVLVLYIQSGPADFADTSSFNDQADSCRQAISGVSVAGRSLLTFASGFQPNYTIALAPAAVGTGGLWQLANGTNNSLLYMGSVNLTPLNNSGPYTFSFPAALIGMIPGVRSTLQLFGTYVRTDGSRSTEAIAGNLTGTQGWNPFTQTAYASYTFDASAVLVKLPLGVWAQRASNSLAGREWPAAVWTGSEMIVWGGDAPTNVFFNDGGRYNPAANSWSALPTEGAPAPRTAATAVWTGREMIVWGGDFYAIGSGSTYFNDGGRYNPATDSWTPVTTSGAPEARWLHTAVWTGSQMIIWGGWGQYSGILGDGGCYDPATDSWTPVTTTGAPGRRDGHSAVWTGSEMIVWGGYYGGRWLNDGGRYNPTTDSWTPVTTTGAPSGRRYHTALWTGSQMIVWGGWVQYVQYGMLGDGGCYDPANDSWTPVTTSGAPGGRYWHTAVWTGGEMIVWGGYSTSSATSFNDGGRYNPAANNWTAVPTNGAPAGRCNHAAVWTGSEMMVSCGWGSGYTDLSDTWSYYPYVPAVRISRSSPSSALVAWPVWSSTLRLCQTTNVAAGQWTTVTNAITQVGSENHVTLSPLSGSQFFRAEYP